MMKTGDHRLIHSYHIAQVPRSRLPFVARMVGLGTLLTGAGIALAGITELAVESPVSLSWAFALPIALFIVGMGIILATIVVFTFRPWS